MKRIIIRGNQGAVMYATGEFPGNYLAAGVTPPRLVRRNRWTEKEEVGISYHQEVVLDVDEDQERVIRGIAHLDID